MKKDLSDFLNVAPLIEEKKKYQNFRVVPIGGPAEIGKWRAMQEAKEYAYRIKLGERDARISEAEKTLGKLDEPKLSKQGWKEKSAFAAIERQRLAQLEPVTTDYSKLGLSSPEPKKTVFQRVTGFLKRIWSNAQF